MYDGLACKVRPRGELNTASKRLLLQSIWQLCQQLYILLQHAANGIAAQAHEGLHRPSTRIASKKSVYLVWRQKMDSAGDLSPKKASKFTYRVGVGHHRTAALARLPAPVFRRLNMFM